MRVISMLMLILRPSFVNRENIDGDPILSVLKANTIHILFIEVQSDGFLKVFIKPSNTI